MINKNSELSAILNNINNNPGTFLFITGSMFGGKTTMLIDILHNLGNFKVFKSKKDSRGKPDLLQSRNGTFVSCTQIKTPQEIPEYIDNSVKVIGIDEVQFFEDDILYMVNYLLGEGYTVIASGLLTDYKNRVFGYSMELLTYCLITKKSLPLIVCGDCSVCGEPTTYTHRKEKTTDKQLLIGDSDEYEPRCERHHPYQFLNSNCTSASLLE